MLNDILAAIPFGIILAFTIGPVFFVLLETGATKGFRSAIIFDLGVILADTVFIFVAFFSTDKLDKKIWNDPNFIIFGGVILITYGLVSFVKTSKSFRSIVKEYHKVDIKKNALGKLFVKGFLLNFINIGVLIGWLAFIAIGRSATESENGVTVFIVTMVSVYFLTDLVKIAVAKRLRNRLTPRLIYKTKKIVALAIIGFGILLLIQGLFPSGTERLQESIEQRL